MTTQHYLPPAPINTPSGSIAWAEWYRLMRISAESGQTAYITINDPTTGLQSKLNSDAADTLNGTISFGTLGAFKVGTVTWNGTSATGTGVMFTQNGIVGANSGSIKFVIKSDGTATFGGALTAATGTFAGDVNTSGGMYASGYANASVTVLGTTYDPSVYGQVTGALGSGTSTGLMGVSTMTGGSVGVTGISTSASTAGAKHYGGTFVSVSSNTSGILYGSQFISAGGDQSTGIDVSATNNNNTTNVKGITVSSDTNKSILNRGIEVTQTGGNSSSAGIRVASSTGVAIEIQSGLLKINDTSLVGTGAATATFPGTNKPGSNSTNTWLKINLNGTDYYIPVWT